MLGILDGSVPEPPKTIEVAKEDKRGRLCTIQSMIHGLQKINNC